MGGIIFVSLQLKGAGEELGAGSPSMGTRWGPEVGRRGTVSPHQGGRLGVLGVLSLEGPIFPQGLAGRECWVFR